MSETLLEEIRATKPAAPTDLRERVRSLSAQEPARAPFLARFEWRRLVLVVPAALVVAVIAGSVIGLTRDDVVGGGEQAASDESVAATTVEAASGGTVGTNTVPAFEALTPKRERQRPLTDALQGLETGVAGVVPPVPGQLQRFEAELRLRVDDVEALSNTTKRAQQIAANHGGTVASLQYDAPSAGVGAAQITLRIPTARVQSALTQLSALGTILGQRYGIEDLQQQADGLQTQIEQTQRQIAQLRVRLENTTLSDETRIVLEGRLGNARQKLTSLRQARGATIAEARTATVFLSLTTEEIEPAAVGSGSRLDDIKDVLAWEGIALLYVLVVAGPFLILGLLVWLALRLRRRQVETRLLEQN